MLKKWIYFKPVVFYSFIKPKSNVVVKPKFKKIEN